MGNLRGALAVALLACGSPQHGASQGPGPDVAIKSYAPLGIKADAKVAHQAVILGTDASNGSTVLPLPAAPAHAIVDAMFVRLAPKPATGGLTPIKLATAPNPDRSVQVGVFQDLASGTGPQWRAGVWMSAIVAATALDKDLTDFTFSASSGGPIDGASASGLMAGGFLAAITGAPIDARATMTGFINPDGTVGPVAGLPEKLLASIDKGKRRFGYPIGMRFAKSEATGETVDLEQLAKAHGAEAVEVADVHAVYKLLTNRTLPQTLPVAEADMALDAAQQKVLEARYLVQQRELATKWATIVQLDSAGRLPASLRTIRDLAKTNGEGAEQQRKHGELVDAYRKIVVANSVASATGDAAELLAKVQRGDLAGARAMLDALGERARAGLAIFQEIGALKPSTLASHLAMMAGFEDAVESWVYERFADDALTQARVELDHLADKKLAELGSPKVAEEAGDRFVSATLMIARTLAGVEVARLQLALEATESVDYLFSVPNVARVATSFESASAAGLDYFETLFVEPLAKSAQLSLDDARARFAASDYTYLETFRATTFTRADGVPKQLAAAWGEQSLAWGLLSLGASEVAYLDAAELVARYVSLGVHLDDREAADKIAYERAFTNMLANAERSARASARAARIATGAIPVQAKLAYARAMVARDGDLEAKLSALAALWQSSAMSQTAVMLARN